MNYKQYYDFDYITFGILVFILNTYTVDQFGTTWFIESIISACTIVLILRIRKSILKSKPGKYLLLSTLFIISLVIILPFTLVGKLLGLTDIPTLNIVAVGIIVLLRYLCRNSKKGIL